MKFHLTLLSALLLFLLKTSGLVAQTPFSHSALDTLLQQNVRGGLVYYPGFYSELFEKYLDEIAAAKPEKWERNEQIAFWINAYNSAVIAQVLKNPGLRMVSGLPHFFKDSVTIGQQKITLDSARAKLALFKEPLVYFGLNSAAMSYPKLENRAFKGATVIKELQKNARAFLKSEDNLLLDVPTNTVYISKLFLKEEENFKNGKKSVLNFLVEYAPPVISGYLAVHKDSVKIEYLDFNERLNGRLDEPAVAKIKAYEKPKKEKKKKGKK
ncbi:MAG TPA: DUF547 domain-containing protein [Patescibacteria group bacterium]|nr:DUF547 domain-containing protein [Patescibacteria group bacterium]